MSEKNEEQTKFELRFTDLTKDAQERLVNYDPDIPEYIINGEKPIWSLVRKDGQINSVPSEGLNATTPEKIAGSLGKLLSMMGDKVGLPRVRAEKISGPGGELPDHVKEEALKRLKAGEDIGGVTYNKLTGEAVFMTKDQALEMALKEGANHECDDAACQLCPVKDCPEHPDNKDNPLGSHIGDVKWN